MSQLSLSLPYSTLARANTPANGTLMVRDAQGHYREADEDAVMQAATTLVERRLQRGTSLNEPRLVQNYLVTKMALLPHEVFGALLVDTQYRLIACVELAKGTIDHANVHPREVVKEIMKHNATAVLFFHNHPSGNPEPSLADRAMTDRLKAALALIDVRVVDHLVVGGTTTTSLAARGWV